MSSGGSFKPHLGTLFIISAPAGTGKTTLVNMLVREFPSVVASVSFTTRRPRPGEQEGVHYHFISHAEFEQRIVENEFLEHVLLYGERYGTSALWIQSRLQRGMDVILVIDTQGARLLRDLSPSALPCHMVSIFIMPPSLEELERRLRGRGTEAEGKIRERLLVANREMEEMEFYDYGIVNDDLHAAYEVLRSVYIADKHRIKL
jgi:guanylate kinase